MTATNIQLPNINFVVMKRLRAGSLRGKKERKAWNRLLDGLSFFLSFRAELSCGLSRKAWFSYAADMPGTYPPPPPGTPLRHVNIYRRIMICPRYWPQACLRSWAEFNFAGKPAIIGDKNVFCVNIIWTICGHNVWRNNLIFSDNSILYRWNGWKLRQFNFFAFHPIAIWGRWRSIADALGTHWNRFLNIVSYNQRLCRS